MIGSDIYFPEKKVFKTLLHLDYLRGPHSTGVATISKDNDIALLKAVGGPWDLYRQQPKDFDVADDTVKQYNLKGLIGHNRFATMGAKIAENAHPFLQGNIVGAHNGTLEARGLHRLDDVREFDVDSEAIFYNINKNGFEETMGRLLGAWALTFYDKKEEKMHFIRNDQRSLYYCYSEDQKVLFWASEPWMLEVAAAKNNYKISETESFKPFIHYSMNLKGDGNLKNKNLIFEEKQYKGFIHPVVQYQQPHHGNNFKNMMASNTQKNGIFGNFDKTIQRMKSFVNKEIEFVIIGEGEDSNKVPFLVGDPAIWEENWNIRIYASGNKRWNEWKNSNGHYTATGKKVIDRWDPKSGNIERYLLVDLRTISAEILPDVKKKDEPKKVDEVKKDADFLEQMLSPFPWPKNGIFTGYLGVSLNYEDFLNATRAGCEWCSEDVTDMYPPETLAFVAHNRFICPICNKNGQAERFYIQ